ncbi:hypothetical protein Y032_0083g1647 [Ancylostoma ceylanicum]|uniref:Uncharacterized protein n=1 Tax=Ancylostoma ceylanicum TaxID=53326 RepID=A0A016TS06_9BILA|nr:hypothetical protein Y032_0083g1647 [Ancylostoma ceylanicum]
MRINATCAVKAFRRGVRKVLHLTLRLKRVWVTMSQDEVVTSPFSVNLSSLAFKLCMCSMVKSRANKYESIVKGGDRVPLNQSCGSDTPPFASL